MQTGLIVRPLACAAALLLCGGAYRALRLGWAERAGGRRTVQAAARSAALEPDNPAYWLRLADLRQASGESPGDAYHRAASAAPRDARVAIALGLYAEMRGDLERAERSLLEAARFSRLYEPRWTLANFYFRRGRPEEFWHWARSAAEWACGDRRPLYRLGWAMSDDAGEILRRLLPDDRAALGSYLDFLLAERRLEAAEGCAARLAPHAGPENRDTLLGFVETMVVERRYEAAWAAWKEMCSRRLLPYAPRAAGPLTNGDFAQPALQAGFDWRTPRLEGLAASFHPGLARLSFTGRQPERCEALQQIVPIQPGAHYTLRFEYRSEGLPAESGIEWTLWAVPEERAAAAGVRPLSAAGWTASSARFTAPAGARWARLALECRRLPGAVRAAGTVWLRKLSLEEDR